MALSRTRTLAAAIVAAGVILAAHAAPVPNAPGLNKLTASNAGGLLRGEARAEWARLNASAKQRASERLEEVGASLPARPRAEP